MDQTRPGAYSIDSVHLALHFKRKAEAETKPTVYFTIDTLRRLVAAMDAEGK